MTTVFRIALVSFLAATCAVAQDVVSVKSPDGRIEFRLFDGPPNLFTQQPHLAYQVDLNGKRLIDTSYLGFEIANQLPLGQKLGLVDVAKETSHDYNEVVANYLQNGSLGRRMTMEVRAFNDGVAFRYVVPTTSQLLRMPIESEMTQFAFSRDGDAYPLLLRGFQTGYAENYSKLTLSGIHNDSLVGLPFLVEQPGVGWAAITEADLDEYAGMYLRRVDGRAMQAVLSPRVDGSGLAVEAKTPVVTPWRVILIADKATKLIESDIVSSLNRATEIRDTSWIQPGKAVRDTSDTTAGIRSSIDFAASAGLEYVLLSEGSTTIGLDLPSLLSYAREKKVGLWITFQWRSAESQMDAKFAELERWGVRGIVIEGMNRDDQAMVTFYHQVASKAAEHHLMLDFHGAYKPEGLSQTFPNVLTQDAALGSEYSKWGARANPEHNVMLAFSRLLAGPLDYGLGGFNNVTREEFAPSETAPMTLGTRAHQLALFVVFESPLQILAGDAKSYDGERDFEFVKDVPTSWDAAKAISGEVGRYVAIARNRGRDWYLGAITSWDAREIDLPLTFLGAGDYIAKIYGDASEPTRTTVEERRVTATDSLHLKLASGGGAAVRFRPAN